MRGLVIVLALIALIGGGGWGVRTYAPQYLPDEWTTDAVLRERLYQRALAEDEAVAAFLTKFQTLFPADHAEVLTQLVALYRRGSTGEQMRQFVESYMRRFIEDNRTNAAAAEPAALTALSATLAESIGQLRQESVAICADAFRGGAYSTPPELMSHDTKAAFMRITNAMLDAIASGKRTPTQYADPTPAQWGALIDRYVALGGDQAALETVGVNPQALADGCACAVAEHLWTAIAQAEDDFAPRFVSYSLRQR